MRQRSQLPYTLPALPPPLFPLALYSIILFCCCYYSSTYPSLPQPTFGRIPTICCLPLPFSPGPAALPLAVHPVWFNLIGGRKEIVCYIWRYRTLQTGCLEQLCHTVSWQERFVCLLFVGLRLVLTNASCNLLWIYALPSPYTTGYLFPAWKEGHLPAG